MKNDRVFTLYALTLLLIGGGMITAAIMMGLATVPTTGIFLEHLALGLGVRAAYKSFGGFDWLYELADWAGFYELEATAPNTGAEVPA